MRSIRSSFVWMGGAQLLTVASQFVAQIVLARCLSVHDAGIYAFALSVVALLSLVQAAGLKALIIREEVLSEEVEATAFTMNALITIGLSLAILLFALFGGAFLREEGVRHVLQAMAVTPLFSIFFFLPAARMERDGQFARIAVIGIAGALAGTVATIWLALNGWTYMSVPYGQWVTGAVTMILTNVLGWAYARMRISFRSWRRIGGFGMQMLAVAGVNTASSRFSEIALARLQGLEMMGLFFRASSLNTVLWVNLHTLIGRVMLVDFARLHRQGISFRDRYLRCLDITTGLLWPVFLGAAVLSAPALKLIFGAKWVAAAPALSMILIASMIQISISMTWEIFAAKDLIGVLTRIEYIRSLITLTLFVAACFVSMELAAAVRIVDALLAVLLYRRHLHSMTDTTGRDFLKCYMRSMMLTVLACLPAFVLVCLSLRAADIPLVHIAGAVALGGVLWCGGLAVLRHPLLEQVGALLNRRAAAPLSDVQGGAQ